MERKNKNIQSISIYEMRPINVSCRKRSNLDGVPDIDCKRYQFTCVVPKYNFHEKIGVCIFSQNIKINW